METNNKMGMLPGMYLKAGSKVINIYKPMSLYVAVNSKIRTMLFRKENKTAVPGRTVFLGDSITMMCDWTKLFPDLPSYNRGIDSETTYEVAARLKESVYDLKPSTVVYLAGQNDLFREQHKAEEILESSKALLEKIEAFDPTIRIIVQSAYPTNDGSPFLSASVNEEALRLNEKLKALCEEKGYTYVDVHSALVGADGRFRPELTKDGVHPNEQGYEVVKSVLAPVLAQ